MQVVTLQTISAALELIDSKKENLKKAFDELQSHSSLLSSFSLTWSDLDSHFTSIHNSLTQRFHQLESLESHQLQNHPTNQQDPSSSSQPATSHNVVEPTGVSNSVPPRPVLKRLCEVMDGKGLRDYIIDQRKDREAIRTELPAAIKCAPDPAVLVLDAVEGFYSDKANSDGDRGQDFGIRRTCLLLLETLMDTFPNLGNHVRERAKMLAMDWKGNVNLEGEKSLEALGFLHLVATYGLKSEFDVGELVRYCCAISQYRQATKLCKAIDLGSNTADLVHNLINKGRQLLAVRFIFEFKLTDKFPPVSLLKEYLKESEKLAEATRKEGKNSLKSLNEATAKEVGALKSVVKIIEEHNIDSEYPRANLENRIKLLEKQQAGRKRPAVTTPVKAKQSHEQQRQQQQQRMQRQKRPRMAGPVGSSSVLTQMIPTRNSTALPYQQSRHLQASGFLPDHLVPYESTSAVPYGMAGSTPTASVASYASSAAGLYGMAGGHTGYSGNASIAASSQVYPSETYAPPPGYYDASASYGGYAVPPQYHASYFPQ